MIYTITGKAGQGKTITILDKLLSAKTKNNLIITNPQTVEFYESFLANNHVRGKILTITEVARYVWEAAGIFYPESASTIAKYAAAIKAINSSNDLLIVKNTEITNGVVNKVVNAVSDIKKEAITSDQIINLSNNTQYGGPFACKLHDISILMPEIEKNLCSCKYIFEEDIPLNFKEQGLPSNMFDNIFIDTLPAYNTYCISIITSLFEISSDVFIAIRLTSKKDRDFFVFSDGVNAYSKILDFARQNGYDLSELKASRKTSLLKISNLKRGIDVLGDVFFEKRSTPVSIDDSVALYEASSASSEVDFVCSEIMKLASQGVNYDDIIVCAPVAEEYLPFVQEAFLKNNIPMHYFKTNILSATRLYLLVDSLLTAAIKELTVDDLLEIAHLNFFDISADDMSILDNFATRFGPDIDLALTNCKEFDPDNFETVNNFIQSLISAIQYLANELTSSHNAEEYTRSIINFLIAYDAQTSLKKDIDNLYNGNEYQMCQDVLNMWNSMIDVFDCITNIYAQEPMELVSFIHLFEKLCTERKIINNEKYFGEVRFLSLPDTTNGRSKYLFVMGCNEGALITVPEEAFFSDDEKVVLNNELSCSLFLHDYYIGKKISDVYSAFTSPYDKLYISWPSISTSYSTVTRAGILDNIFNVFSENLIKETNYIKELGESDFINLLCIISECVKEGRPFDNLTLEKINKYSNHPMFKDRFALAIKNLYTSKNTFNIKYDVDTNFELSVTKAEKYNDCPFKFFVSTVLTPKEKKLFAETAANKGVFYHNVFKDFYNTLAEKSIDVKTLAKDKKMFSSIIHKIIDSNKKRHNENIFTSSPKYNFLSQIMSRIAEESVWYSLLQLSRGEYKPAHNEYIIDPSENAFELTNGQNVYMAGIIDRVDIANINNNKYARIIDYKSGNVTFDVEKLSAGIQLQLPLYLKSLKDYSKGGMYYFHVHTPVLTSDCDEEDILPEYKLSGPTLGTTNALIAADNTLAEAGSISSDVIRASVTADGQISKRSYVVSEQEMNGYIKIATEKFLQAAEGISKGQISATPVVLKNYSACDYCSYKSLCSG